MGISSGNDSMFLVGSHAVKVIRTCTENPRVGSSILSLGTMNSSTYEIFVGAFFV